MAVSLYERCVVVTNSQGAFFTSTYTKFKNKHVFLLIPSVLHWLSIFPLESRFWGSPVIFLTSYGPWIFPISCTQQPFICLFCFLGLHLGHMEFPRLGIELELQLLVYASATAMQDLSLICDLRHSSQQCQILNPLSEARDWTLNPMVSSWFLFHCATTGTPAPLSL